MDICPKCKAPTKTAEAKTFKKVKGGKKATSKNMLVEYCEWCGDVFNSIPIIFSDD